MATNHNPPPTVGFVAAANYYDRNAWSGTLFSMHQALKKIGLNIVDLGNPRSINLHQRIKKKVARMVFRGNGPATRPGTAEYQAKYRDFALHVKKQLERHPCDLLFAPAGSAEITFLETTLPVIYLSDVTFALFLRDYPSDYTSAETEFLEYQEKTAIRKATALIYPSAWAARSAVEDYQANPASIEIFPFGANLEEVPDACSVTGRSRTSPCRLLWIGRNWQRKGGRIAVETLHALKKKGIPATLTLIGCHPPKEVPTEDVTVIPNIDKNNPEQKKLLQSYFTESHFFVFPTRADCSPIVLCEAAAYGLPSMASDVGGVSTIIENGRNGYLFPLEAGGEEYAARIAELIADQDDYDRLVISSRNAYDTRLNWGSWAENFRALSEKALRLPR